jgi:Tfp pilus assembly protein PilX
MLLAALGVALIVVTDTETRIAANFRDGQEALYAADAGLERAAQDLPTLSHWNDVLNGSVRSGFTDGTTMVSMPGGGDTLDLQRLTQALQAETDAANLWGSNNPRWTLYAAGAIANLLPTGTIDSQMYVAVWAADDPSETDGDPQSDTNGVLTFHAEAFGHGGTHKVVEMTVARTPPGVEAGLETVLLSAGGSQTVRVLSWREVR